MVCQVEHYNDRYIVHCVADLNDFFKYHVSHNIQNVHI